MTGRREEKALASVVSEAKNERVPELDWAKLEAKLDELPPPAAPQKPSPLRFLVPPLALAAAGAVLYFALPEPRVAPVAERAPVVEVATPTNGDALVPGSRVEAREASRVVSHPQRATWTLEPGSVAEVVRTGEIITIRLLAGSVSAEVVPRPRPETFVIEAREMRVAVHGTRFRVALGEEGVDVAVTEGRVMVGPREKPGTGKLLVGPAAEHFSPVAPAEKRPTPPAAPAPTLPSSAAPEPAATDANTDTDPDANTHADTDTHARATATPTPASPVAPAVPEPSPGAVDTATLHAIELTSACFRQRSVAAPEPSPAVQTTLTLKGLPDGTISSVQFLPPLPRQVELCVRDGLKSLHAPVSPRGIEVSRAITLGR